MGFINDEKCSKALCSVHEHQNQSLGTTICQCSTSQTKNAQEGETMAEGNWIKAEDTTS